MLDLEPVKENNKTLAKIQSSEQVRKIIELDNNKSNLKKNTKFYIVIFILMVVLILILLVNYLIDCP